MPAGPSRRDFLMGTFAGVLSASTLLRTHPFTAWARQSHRSVSPGGFDIQMVTTDVYFAQARPWALSNSNAVLFVNSSDVLIVDAHSHPAAASALIDQIKNEVTAKPVRWLVNTHFHWDHTQGNGAYLATHDKIDILASNTTKQLMSQLLKPRLRAALDPTSPGPRGSQQVARQLKDLRQRISVSTGNADTEQLPERIAQLESFANEMRDFEPALPTITFDKSYVIQEKDYDLHLQFPGLGHTAGDIMLFCPQKGVIVTGDVHNTHFPGFTDSYPQLWPSAINSIAALQFDHILPGHGRLEHDKRGMICRRDYIEELTKRVLAGKRAGQSVAHLQRTITADSLKSLRSGVFRPAETREVLQNGISENIDAMYDRVEKSSFDGTEPVRLRG